MDSGIETIIVGVWDGDIENLINIIAPYSLDFTIRVFKKKLIIKDYNYNYYKCIHLGSNIIIPRYEPDFNWLENDDPDY